MASKYWVLGGNEDWGSPTNWSDSSGGVSGATPPTEADDAFFDAASGAGNSIISTEVNVLSLDMTGYTGTFTMNPDSSITTHGDNITLIIEATTLNIDPTASFFLNGANSIFKIPLSLQEVITPPSFPANIKINTIHFSGCGLCSIEGGTFLEVLKFEGVNLGDKITLDSNFAVQTELSFTAPSKDTRGIIEGPISIVYDGKGTMAIDNMDFNGLTLVPVV